MALEERENKAQSLEGLPIPQVFVLLLFVRKRSVPEARSPAHTGKRRRRSPNSARRSSGRSRGRGAPGSWTDRRLRRQERGERSGERGWGPR